MVASPAACRSSRRKCHLCDAIERGSMVATPTKWRRPDRPEVCQSTGERAYLARMISQRLMTTCLSAARAQLLVLSAAVAIALGVASSPVQAQDAAAPAA